MRENHEMHVKKDIWKIRCTEGFQKFTKSAKNWKFEKFGVTYEFQKIMNCEETVQSKKFEGTE